MGLSHPRNRVLMPFLTMFAFPVVFATAGCGPAHSPRLVPAPGVSAAEAPTYDPDRAFLTLNQIEPVPALPVAPAAERPPLSAKSAEVLREAEALAAQRRHTDASLLLEGALRDDPSAVEIHRALARVYSESGASARGRLHADKAIELRVDDGATHYLLGLLALSDGCHEEAIEQFRIALLCGDVTSRPQRQAMAHYRLALALEGEGYLTAALGQYRAFEAIVRDLGERSGDDRELATLLQVEGHTAALAIAAICERLGRFGEAADALEQALVTQGATAETQARLARLLARAGRADRALEHARAIEGDSELVVSVLREVYALSGRSDRLVDEFRRLCQRRPGDFVLVEALVDELTARERWAEGERALRAHIAVHPDAPAGYWALFGLLGQQSRWGDAVSAAADLLRHRPELFAAARSKVVTLADDADAVASLLAQEGGDVTLPGDGSRAYLLGCLAAQAGRAAVADRLWRRCIELSGESTGARIELAKLYCEQYRWDDAIQVTQVGEPPSLPHPQIEQVLAEAYAGLDRFEEAVAHYNEAIRLHRADTQAMLGLAALFERMDEPLRAQRQYEAILKEDPLNAVAQERLAMLYLEAGERDATVDQLVQLRKMAAPAAGIARCVARLSFSGRSPDYEQFRATLLESSPDGPADADSLYLLASSYYAEQEYASARPFLERALAVDRDHEPSLELCVWLARETLDFEEAERWLRILTSRYPNRVLWRRHLIDVLLIVQKHTELIGLLRPTLENDSLEAGSRRRCRVLLVEALHATGQHEEAVSTVEAWHRSDPEDSNLRARLVEAYIEAGRGADARAEAEAWCGESASSESREALIRAYTRTGQYDPACQFLLEKLENDPESSSLLIDLITVLTDAKRTDQALDILEDRVAYGDNPATYQELAVLVYDAARRHDDAVTAIGKWIQRETRRWRGNPPRDVQQMLSGLLAQQLIRGERFDEARNRLIRWIDETREPVAKTELLLLLAECERRRGRPDLAIEAMVLAHELNPLDEDLRNSLGYTWADAGTNLARAEEFIRYAVARSPRNAAYLDSLGWVLYKKGEFAGAVRWLTLAAGAATGVEDALIHDHLGDAYWRLGEAEQALAQWEAAIAKARENGDGEGGPDWQRVLDIAPKKIEAARAGRPPDTAPLGETQDNADQAA